MITTTIEWHNTADELPTSSDIVLTYNGYGVMSCNYSSKYKLFNSADYYETEEEAKEHAIYPLLWAKMPDFTANESEGE